MVVILVTIKGFYDLCNDPGYGSLVVDMRLLIMGMVAMTLTLTVVVITTVIGSMEMIVTSVSMLMV